MTLALAFIGVAALGNFNPVAQATDACSSGSPPSKRGDNLLQRSVQPYAVEPNMNHTAFRTGLGLAQMQAKTMSRRSMAARARHQARLYDDHSVALKQQHEKLMMGHSKADDEINAMIDKFMSEQSSSEDHCSAQLIAAKKELHILHKHTTDLVKEVQVLEVTIANQTTELTVMYQQDAEALEWEEAELQVCYEENEEDKAMYDLLKEELIELMRIANSTVSITSEQWNSYKANFTNRSETHATVNVTVNNYTMEFSCLPSTGDFNCTGPQQYCDEKKAYCDEVHQDHINMREYDCDIETGTFQCIGDDAWCHERQLECQEEFDEYTADQGEKIFKCDLTQGYFNFTCKGDTAWCSYHEEHCRDMYEAGGEGWASDDTNYHGNTGYLGDSCNDDSYICDTTQMKFQCVSGCCWEHFDELSGLCAVKLGLSTSLLEIGAKASPATEHGISLAQLPGNPFKKGVAFAHSNRKNKESHTHRAQSASLLAQKVQQQVSSLQACLDARKRNGQAFRPAQTALMQLAVVAKAQGSHGHVGREGGHAAVHQRQPTATSTSANTTTTKTMKRVQVTDDSNFGYCTDGVEVTIEGEVGAVTLDRKLVVGEFATYPCNNIHAEFTGVIVASCMEESEPVVIDASACIKAVGANDTDECTAQIDNLHEIYIKAYVEITRMLAYYSSYNASAGCVEAVETEFNGKETPITGKVEITRQEISYETRKLESYKLELENVAEAELKLRNHIQMLETKCDAMRTTVSSLDEVRDAITVLGLCPNFNEIAFYVPKFVCTLAPRRINLIGLTDAEIDNKLDMFCKAECSENSRPAEVAELQEQTIEGMPATNTADVPVIAVCPFCEGVPDSVEEDPKHASGHRRVCWGGGAPFNKQNLRKDCSGEGVKSTVCVTDHGADFDDSFGQPDTVEEHNTIER